MDNYLGIASEINKKYLDYCRTLNKKNNILCPGFIKEELKKIKKYNLCKDMDYLGKNIYVDDLMWAISSIYTESQQYDITFRYFDENELGDYVKYTFAAKTSSFNGIDLYALNISAYKEDKSFFRYDIFIYKYSKDRLNIDIKIQVSDGDTLDGKFYTKNVTGNIITAKTATEFKSQNVGHSFYCPVDIVYVIYNIIINQVFNENLLEEE